MVASGGKELRRLREDAELVEKKDGEEHESVFFVLLLPYTSTVPDYKYERLPQFGSALAKHSLT